MIPRKNISIDDAFKLFKKFNESLKRKSVEELGHGTYLGIHQNEEGKRVRLYLKKIFIKKFNMKYSANNKIRSGGEMLISNFELPKGKVIQ